MVAITDLIEKHPKPVVSVFLVALLLLGLGIFRDYGLSWDESIQRQYGKMVYSYITEGDEEVLGDRHRHYGPVFQVLLYSMEKVFGLEDSRSIYLMRHLATFLVFWVGLLFFCLMCKYLFASWSIGLLGCAFLGLSPRIFAHGFYNPKDIPFTAVFIIGMYTLIRYLDRKTVRAAAVHAVVCAIAIDIRIVGVMLPAITILASGLVAVKYRSIHRETRRIRLSIGVYVPVLIGAVLLLWPTLWRDPIGGFLGAFNEMRRFP